MAAVSEKPCWEIMQCTGGECIARNYPEKPCWEHAAAMNFTASVHGVCRDCIVFVAKQKPAVFTEKELTNIFSHQKVYGLNHPKCPAQVVHGRLWPSASERRQAARYRLRGQAIAAISDWEGAVGMVIDVSRRGLSFVHNGIGAGKSQSLQMAISGEDFTLPNLPVQIISDRPLAGAIQEQRRYGVRFTDLSHVQQDMLETIIRQYGQTCFDRYVC